MCINALQLLSLPNFPGPTFIPCPMSIPEARVLQYYNKTKHFVREVHIPAKLADSPNHPILFSFDFQLMLLLLPHFHKG